MPQTQLYLKKCLEPKQFQMGSANDHAIYLDCAGCGAKEPVIHGFITNIENPVTTLDLVAVPISGSHLIKAAVYCEKCWAPIWEKKELPAEFHPEDGKIRVIVN